jgi:membrane protein implicated in regulation of membrane protease activity
LYRSFSRRKANLVVDLTALVAFLAATLSGENIGVHIAVSLVFVFAILVHLALHWKWVVGVSRRMFKGGSSPASRTRANYYVDVFIGAMFVISLVSGLLIIYVDSVPLTKLHGLSSWLFVLGSFAHILLHRRWFVRSLKRSVRAPDRHPIAVHAERRGIVAMSSRGGSCNMERNAEA